MMATAPLPFVRTVLIQFCSLVLVTLIGCGSSSTGPEDAAWTVQTSGTDSVLYDVWGASGDDVFAVGRHGTILHYNGQNWSAMESGSTSPLYSVCGRSAKDVYAVGDSGLVIHYDGLNWAAMESRISCNLRGVWTAPDHSVYAVGSYGVYQRDESEWRRIRFLSSARSIIGFDGRIHPAVNVGNFQMYVAVGRRLFMAINSTWIAGPTVVQGIIYDIWGTSPAHIFVVTSRGRILRNEGAGLAHMEHPDVVAIAGIHGRSLEDVYAVGSYGAILHYDGEEWKLLDSPTDERLNSVWVADNGDAFVVGSAGTILHRDDE